jgi:hypothetical protein
VARAKHPKKEIEKALTHLEAQGWTVEPKSSGHSWGIVKCGQGCSASVWSTPRNYGNHAKQLTRLVRKCPHA